MKNKILKLFIFIILILLILIISAYCIDKNRMKNGKPVLFWNWGHPYSVIIYMDPINLIITPADEGNMSMIKVTTKKFNKKYGYDIYYYQIKSVSITGPKTKDLIKELEDGKITSEIFFGILKHDVDKGIATCETTEYGEARKYTYETYSIIKCHTIEGNENIYFGPATMQFEDVNI